MIWLFFYLTRPLLLGEVPTFSKTPPSPLNLKIFSSADPATPETHTLPLPDALPSWSCTRKQALALKGCS